MPAARARARAGRTCFTVAGSGWNAIAAACRATSDLILLICARVPFASVMARRSPSAAAADLPPASNLLKNPPAPPSVIKPIVRGAFAPPLDSPGSSIVAASAHRAATAVIARALFMSSLLVLSMLWLARRQMAADPPGDLHVRLLGGEGEAAVFKPSGYPCIAGRLEVAQ